MLCKLQVFHLRLRQKISSSGKFVKIQNLMAILHFKMEALSLFLILTLRMNISYYVCGKPTQYQCEYLLFRWWIQVFSPMSDSSLQYKIPNKSCRSWTYSSTSKIGRNSGSGPPAHSTMKFALRTAICSLFTEIKPIWTSQVKKYVEKIARSSYSSLQLAQVNLQAGMDLLGGGGGAHPP